MYNYCNYSNNCGYRSSIYCSSKSEIIVITVLINGFISSFRKKAPTKSKTMTTWLWEDYIRFDFENIIQPSIPMGLYKHSMTGFANAKAPPGVSSYDPWSHVFIFLVFRYYRPFGSILDKLTTEGEEKKVAGFLNQYSVTKCWNILITFIKYTCK